MKHKVYCYQCKKFVDLDMAGDLGQFNGDTIDCPCGEETLAIKAIPLYGLFSIYDLRLPLDTIHKLENQ